jgi:hypothetical protein
LYNQNLHCLVGKILRETSELLYYFDNKTLSNSNFIFILFYKKCFGHFVQQKFKIMPSKFQFFLQLKKGFIANMLYDGPPCIIKRLQSIFMFIEKHKIKIHKCFNSFPNGEILLENTSNVKMGN